MSVPPASVPAIGDAENPPRALYAAVIDQALVRRFLKNDETAFIEIMERYRGKIFTVTFSLLRNHADAEEVTQDTFIRAYRGLATFRGDSSLATWLYRIAVNLSRNRYWYFFRRRKQDTYSLDHALGDEGTNTFADRVSDVGQDPAESSITTEFCALVDRCLEKLEARHREILTLRIVLNRSYDEIATTLKINIGTVKSRIARAREHLRVMMAESCPEFPVDADPKEWFLRGRGNYHQPTIHRM